MAGRNAFYAQSGGVSAVINSSACGVLQTARRYPDQIVKIYAGHNGILGALTEDLIDTSLEPELAIAALKHTPGAAFGSCRYKLGPIDEHRAEYARLIEIFFVRTTSASFFIMVVAIRRIPHSKSARSTLGWRTQSFALVFPRQSIMT